jgi:hypothetical protein
MLQLRCLRSRPRERCQRKDMALVAGGNAERLLGLSKAKA